MGIDFSHPIIFELKIAEHDCMQYLWQSHLLRPTEKQQAGQLVQLGLLSLLSADICTSLMQRERKSEAWIMMMKLIPIWKSSLHVSLKQKLPSQG